MPRKTLKNRRGGGSFLDRYARGANIKTFCCDSKTTIANGYNEGLQCQPSWTGQCSAVPGTGQNYKFRCYNTISGTENNPRERITDSDYGENCKYVAGMLGKAAGIYSRLGGRKSKRRKSFRRRRSSKRR
jgi:hypothetical protein